MRPTSSTDAPSRWGYVAAMSATALWSGNLVIARGLSEAIPPISLAFLRWTLAALVLLPFGWRSLRAEWPVLRRHPLHLLATSIFGVSVFNTLIYQAGRTTSAVNLSLISISAPIFLMILSRVLFGERFTRRRVLGIVTVVVGVLLLLTGGDPTVLTELSFAQGDAWMLSAAFMFAVYTLLLKTKPEGVGIWAFQTASFSLGALFLLPAFLWERAVSAPLVLEASILGAVAYVGVFASLLAYVLWSQAIQTVGPARAGMVYYTLPMFSGGLAWAVLGEPLGMVHVGSMGLIVGGISVANRERG